MYLNTGNFSVFIAFGCLHSNDGRFFDTNGSKSSLNVPRLIWVTSCCTVVKGYDGITRIKFDFPSSFSRNQFKSDIANM